MFKKLLVAAMFASAIGTVAVPAAAAVYVQVAPPPLRVEPAPVPRRGYVWVPGYWEWRHRQHVWIPGRYVTARPGYVYVGPTWVERGGRWYYTEPGWRAHDRDGDGVPNRLDRHPDNPYRR